MPMSVVVSIPINVRVFDEHSAKFGCTSMYVFILQQDNTQNIKPEGQQGSETLTAARNKKMSRTNISDNLQYDRS